MPPAKLGDMVLADGAVRGEGTSRTYAPIGYPAVADFDLGVALSAALARRNASWRAGLFGTYDGFYTEMFALSSGQKQLIDAMRDEVRRLGLIATDMETATLLTAGRVLGAQAASLCLGTVDGLTQEKIDPASSHRESANCSKSRSTPLSPILLPNARSPIMSAVAHRYFSTLIERLEQVRDTQGPPIERAAEACARSIAEDKLVFSFGRGGARRRRHCIRAARPDARSSLSRRCAGNLRDARRQFL